MEVVLLMPENVVVGGLYSVENGNGTFGVVKVLALDPGIVHARLYREKFESRPTSVDPINLSLGSIYESADIGIGHVPLPREGFMSWKPEFILQVTVTDEELVGYRIWLDAGDTGTSEGSLKSIVRRVAGIVRSKRHN